MDSSRPQGTARRAPPRFFFELVPPSPEANIQSPFFQIALELRDTIYHHLWDGEKIPRCEEGGIGFSLDYGNSDKWCGRQLLPWPLACKQMLAEAMSQFYRHARCTSYDYLWPGNILESPFRLLSLYRVGTVVHQYAGYPCRLEVVVPTDNEGKFYAIREYVIGDSGDIEYEEEVMGSVSDYASLDKYQHQDFTEWALVLPDYHRDFPYHHPNDPVLSKLVEHLWICNHMVKDLTLEFKPPTYLDRDTHPEIMQDGKERTVYVDMSYLERLGANFDRVEFILSAWRIVQDSWDHRTFVKIQQEFARVAKVLIGADDGATWALRDWFASDNDITGGWHVEVSRITNGPSGGEITYKGLFSVVESHSD